MGYYWLNIQELLKKANEKYHNKGGNHKEAIKEKQETSIKI